MADHDEEALSRKVAELCSITGIDDGTARALLQNHHFNVNEAADTYLAALDRTSDNDENDESGDEHLDPVPARSTAGRSSGRGPAQAQPTASQSSRPQPSSSNVVRNQPKKKIASLRDLQDNSSQGGQDDDDDKDQEYFAGGDKSGLAVQEPGSSSSARDQIQRLLETARRNGPPPAHDEGPRQTNFSGQGQTLGGDDTPSEIIPDPQANTRRRPDMVERVLHLWADGFSVDDGPLYRYDDPANAQTLEMINRGAAPLDIMNVESGQAVDVKLEAHRNENYVQPKKKYKAFSGSGHRLGSPTPGPSGSTTATSSTTRTAVPGSFPEAVSEAAPQAVHVDETQPVITLQIRLADGTRLPSRFNASHTIGDVYAHVDSASSAGGRAYSLATTFPTKELTDKGVKLGDMAEFKRGGVLVQKWQ